MFPIIESDENKILNQTAQVRNKRGHELDAWPLSAGHHVDLEGLNESESVSPVPSFYKASPFL